jgi:sugar/nucleoside kinase (ribokinase family)
MPLDEALALGARCGAAAVTGRGAFAGQLAL